ncbi:MAG: glycoside hydrolase family 18 protein [Oscillospiraceae bacterium]
MKSRIYKITALALTVLLLFGLVACKTTPPPTSSSTAVEATVAPPQVDPLIDLVVEKPADPFEGFRSVAYYTDWSIYARNVLVEQIDGNLLTHINLAFANLNKDGSIVPGDPEADFNKPFGTALGGSEEDANGVYGQLRQLKAKYPHLQTLISVGGWSWSENFSDVAANPTTRDAFAKSCAEFVAKYGFDGVDIDWEYPVEGGDADVIHHPEDKQNFTLLMKATRLALNEQGEKDGKRYALSIAGYADASFMQNIEPAEVMKYIDFINIMTYDFHGPWDKNTDFNSPMYADTENNPNKKNAVCVTAAIDAYLAAGIAPKDINLGVAFYGRDWGKVESTDNNGVFQKASSLKGTGIDHGTWEAGVFDCWDIEENYINKNGYVRYWDEKAQMPYIFNGSTFINYEDKESIKVKTDYIKEKGLGGAMFWEFGGDKKLALQTVIANELALAK